MADQATKPKLATRKFRLLRQIANDPDATGDLLRLVVVYLDNLLFTNALSISFLMVEGNMDERRVIAARNLCVKLGYGKWSGERDRKGTPRLILMDHPERLRHIEAHKAARWAEIRAKKDRNRKSERAKQREKLEKRGLLKSQSGDCQNNSPGDCQNNSQSTVSGSVSTRYIPPTLKCGSPPSLRSGSDTREDIPFLGRYIFIGTKRCRRYQAKYPYADLVTVLEKADRKVGAAKRARANGTKPTWRGKRIRFAPEAEEAFQERLTPLFPDPQTNPDDFERWLNLELRQESVAAINRAHGRHFRTYEQATRFIRAEERA